MKRIWGHVFTAFLATTAIAAAMPACADNGRTIFVASVLAPSQTRTGGACQYTSEITQPAISHGFLDVGVSGSYRAEILVGNQLIGRGDQAAPRAESNRVQLQGAVVHVTDPSTGEVLADFTSLATGYVDASANNVPSFGPMNVALTDGTTTAALRARIKNRRDHGTVLASFKVFGVTLGNKDVETEAFDFPLDVCNGCSIIYSDKTSSNSDPSKSNEKDPNTGELTYLRCDLSVDDALLSSTTGPCVAGQDGSTDCRLCRGTQSPDLCGNFNTQPAQ